MLRLPGSWSSAWVTRRALVLAAFLVAAAFVSAMLAQTSGHFTGQVDDLYTVCQYARAMAEGHPFRYFPDEPRTSGSTSLLHTAILAAAYGLGARGEGLVAFAIGLGSLLLVLTTLVASRIGRRLAGERGEPEGALAGLLVATCGPVVWAFVYGSDISLYMFLATLCLDRWLAFWQGASTTGFALAGAALALARPEAIVIAPALGVAALFRPGAARDRWLPFAPAVVAAGVLVFHRVFVGLWAPTSMQEKSLLVHFGGLDSAALAATYLFDVIRGLLLGLYPWTTTIGFSRGWSGFAFPPLGLVAVLAVPALVSAPGRRAVGLWLSVVALLFALSAPNILMGQQFNRYLLWAFPGLLALAAVGLSLLTRRLAAGDDERRLFLALAGVWVILGLLSITRFVEIYAHDAALMWHRDVATATWIDRNLPANASFVQVASTTVDYYTRRRSLNPYGITSREFLGLSAPETEASVYEGLARLPEVRRPQYLLVARSTYEAPLFREIAPGPPLFESTSLGDELLVLAIRWNAVGGNREPRLKATLEAVAGTEQVDSLDVCDRRDEADHAYRYDSRMGGVPLAGALRAEDLVVGARSERLADAGRLIVGYESFDVATRAGRDLLIALRSSDPVECRFLLALSDDPNHVRSAVLPVERELVTLEAGGRMVGTFQLDNGPGWNEHVLRIPGALVGGTRTRLRLSGRYSVYGYWFYQKP
jgi:hypothetical protein